MSSLFRPPFITPTAEALAEAVQDAWNRLDVDEAVLRYAERVVWRSSDELLCGREALRALLQRRWAEQLDPVSRIEPWVWDDNRIAVRIEAEWHDAEGRWFRTYALQHWEVGTTGLIVRCQVCSADVPIDPSERRLPRNE